MPKKAFPSELQARFLVRLPDGMRDQIAESAKTNNRSMNAEIVARLQSTFVGQKIGLEPSMTADEIKAHIGAIGDSIAEKLASSLRKQGLVISPEGIALLEHERASPDDPHLKVEVRRRRTK